MEKSPSKTYAKKAATPERELKEMSGGSGHSLTGELSPRYDMFKTVRKIFVKPSSLSPGEALTIDRATEVIKLEHLNKIPTPSTRLSIIGVMGIVKMITCKYLIVIEEISRVGPDPVDTPYLLSNTWRIDKVNMVAVAPGKTRLTHRLAKVNDAYLLAMLEILNSKTFYFSYDVDLSHTLQRVADFRVPLGKKWIFDRAMKMFIWNYSILTPFLKVPSATSFVVPVISGFVNTRVLLLDDMKMCLSVVSRRRRSRTGRRYFSRGINRKGFCSNFIETEMIIEVKKNKVGFVLTRGSYPFYWSQWPDASFHPRPFVMYQETSDDAFDLHVKEVIGMYGRMYIFDLLSQHSDSRARNEFSNFLAMCVENSEFSSRITLQKIDLYSLNWMDEDVLNIEVYSALRDMLMTVVAKSGIQQRQKGVFHICSLDGTDLTDVLQFSIAKLALVSAVLYFELSNVAQSLATEKPQIVGYLTSKLAELWSAQSDALASSYVGTTSLGSDFYKRMYLSKKPSWADFVLKIKRWYVNNFRDGMYQDCLDVCVNNSGLEQVVEYNYKRSFKRRFERRLKMTLALYILPTVVLFCSLHILVLGLQKNDFFCLGKWATLLMLAIALSFKSVSCFIDVPKIVKKPDVKRTAMDWYFN